MLRASPFYCIPSYFSSVQWKKKKLSNLNDGISQARKSVDRPINFWKDFDLWPLFYARIAKNSSNVHLQKNCQLFYGARGKSANLYSTFLLSPNLIHKKIQKIWLENVMFISTCIRRLWKSGRDSFTPPGGNFMVANSSDFHTLIFFVTKIFFGKLTKRECLRMSQTNHFTPTILTTNLENNNKKKKYFLLGNNRSQLKDKLVFGHFLSKIT